MRGSPSLDEPGALDGELARIEEALSAFDTFPLNRDAMPVEAEALYEALQHIAATAEDDKTRARADLHLRLAFADRDATSRHQLRQKNVLKRLQEAGQRLQAAIGRAGWQPPVGLEEALKGLAFGYEISEDDLTDLLMAARTDGPRE